MSTVRDKIAIRACAPFLVLLALGCGGSTDPDPMSLSLVGTWDCIGFTLEETVGECTGTWVFRADGTVSMEEPVTPGGGSPLLVLGSGTYEQSGTTLVLDGTFRLVATSRIQYISPIPAGPGESAGGDTVTFTVSISGDIATLTGVSPTPTFTLRRR